MAFGCVAAWWLMGVPGLVGWIAGAWGGMSASTPWEADEDDEDASEPLEPDDRGDAASPAPGWQHGRACHVETRLNPQLPAAAGTLTLHQCTATAT